MRCLAREVVGQRRDPRPRVRRGSGQTVPLGRLGDVRDEGVDDVVAMAQIPLQCPIQAGMA